MEAREASGSRYPVGSTTVCVGVGKSQGEQGSTLWRSHRPSSPLGGAVGLQDRKDGARWGPQEGGGPAVILGGQFLLRQPRWGGQSRAQHWACLTVCSWVDVCHAGAGPQEDSWAAGHRHLVIKIEDR